MELPQLIAEYTALSDAPKAQEIVRKMLTNYTFLEIVKELGLTLTQTDPQIRVRGTRCLVDLVTFSTDISPYELRAFGVFFLDRLDDPESCGLVADGLKLLLQRTHGSLSFLNSIQSFWQKLESIDMLSQSQHQRYQIYGLLDALATKNVSEDFVNVFTGLCGGEKDPRNLMLLLNTAKTILESDVQLSANAYSLIYDISFCYFPVKFKPSKDDPHSITADDIKQQLNAVLSNHKLVKFTIPGLLSKLNAVNMNVKLESLMGLENVVKNLELIELNENWEILYNGLKPEILAGTPENATFKPCLRVLARLAVCNEFVSKVQSEFGDDLKLAHLYQLCNLVLGVSINKDVWERLAPVALKRALDHPKLVEILASAPFETPDLDVVVPKLLNSVSDGESRDAGKSHDPTTTASIQSTLKTILLNKANKGQYAAKIIAKLEELNDYDSLSELAPQFENEISLCLPKLLSQVPQSLESLAKLSKTEKLATSVISQIVGMVDFNDEQMSYDILTAVYQSLLTGGSELVWELVFDKLFSQVNLQSYRVVELSSKILNVCANAIKANPKLLSYIKSNCLPNSTSVSASGSGCCLYFLSSILVTNESPFTDSELNKFTSRMNTNLIERIGCLRILAIAANKWNYRNELNLDSKSQIEISVWIAKGLVMKNDVTGFMWAKKLAEQCAKSSDVAKVFGILVMPDRIVSKENNCTEYKLYKQRLYAECVPDLRSNSSIALPAIAALLRFTPYVVYKDDPDLPSFTLLCLKSSEPNAQLTGLETLLNFKHIDAEYIELLLDLALNCELSAGRGAAFSLLIRFRNQKDLQLIRQFEEDVLKTCSIGVGDRKREVRQEAVKCRQLYLK